MSQTTHTYRTPVRKCLLDDVLRRLNSLGVNREVDTFQGTDSELVTALINFMHVDTGKRPQAQQLTPMDRGMIVTLLRRFLNVDELLNKVPETAQVKESADEGMDPDDIQAGPSPVTQVADRTDLSEYTDDELRRELKARQLYRDWRSTVEHSPKRWVDVHYGARKEWREQADRAGWQEPPKRESAQAADKLFAQMGGRNWPSDYTLVGTEVVNTDQPNPKLRVIHVVDSERFVIPFVRCDDVRLEVTPIQLRMLAGRVMPEVPTDMLDNLMVYTHEVVHLNNMLCHGVETLAAYEARINPDRT